MHEAACDITSFAWLEHESVGHPSGHEQALILFRDNVVQPSLRALSGQLEGLRASDDPSMVFLVGDLEDLLDGAIEGYALNVQSMWERGLRGMLAARERKLNAGVKVEAILRATWGGKGSELQGHFHRLMGLPLHSFQSYSDLDLLQSLGSAIRHGDGGAARRVHDLCPSLWPTWAQEEDLFEVGRPASPPSFDSVKLSESMLAQMIQSVLWFWEDIEHVRCNSFRRKHESVVAKIATWILDLPQRPGQRLWTPA